MKRQGKHITSRAALLLQALALITFGKQLHNSQNCICDDKDISIPADAPGKALQPRREQLLEQVLDRKSLQILLIHPQVCTTMMKMSKENMKIWQAVFFCAVFKEIGDPENFRGSEAVFPLGKAHF